MKKIALLGPISIDYNVEPDGHVQKEYGGAIVYAAHTASALKVKPAVLVKGEEAVIKESGIFDSLDADLVIAKSDKTTSIRNQYLDPSHERRISTLLSRASGFDKADVENVNADIFVLGGLVYGDFTDDFIVDLAKKGELALDAQCLLRHGKGSEEAMTYENWPGRKEVLPYIKYFKADEKEAQILTEIEDRYKAAELLHKLGAEEVFVSHHTEMMVYNGEGFFRCPYSPDSLIGRTGRGDTVFSSYVCFRQEHDIETALLMATAVVSMKMEKVGPFRESLEAVNEYIAAKHLHVLKS